MRVRTTCSGSAPASRSADTMISRQRRAWASGSGSQEPSGQTGAVPATITRSATRIAREKPMVGSNGEPELMRVRSLIGGTSGVGGDQGHHGGGGADDDGPEDGGRQRLEIDAVAGEAAEGQQRTAGD